MKLLQQLALVCRRKGMAKTTVDAYGGWVNAYLRFIQRRDGHWRHPTELGTADAEAYLNYLVGERHLSASSQNQCLNALVFLYKHVLEDAIPQDHLGKFVLQRSTRPKRLPTVLSVDEVRRDGKRGHHSFLTPVVSATGLPVAVAVGRVIAWGERPMSGWGLGTVSGGTGSGRQVKTCPTGCASRTPLQGGVLTGCCQSAPRGEDFGRHCRAAAVGFLRGEDLLGPCPSMAGTRGAGLE